MSYKRWVVISILLAVLITAAATLVPHEWRNPNAGPDMPSGGASYGFPFSYHGSSCCGIAGDTLTYYNPQALWMNFIVYFLPILLLGFLVLRLRRRQS